MKSIKELISEAKDRYIPSEIDSVLDEIASVLEQAQEYHESRMKSMEGEIFFWKAREEAKDKEIQELKKNIKEDDKSTADMGYIKKADVKKAITKIRQDTNRGAYGGASSCEYGCFEELLKELGIEVEA